MTTFVWEEWWINEARSKGGNLFLLGRLIDASVLNRVFLYILPGISRHACLGAAGGLNHIKDMLLSAIQYTIYSQRLWAWTRQRFQCRSTSSPYGVLRTKMSTKDQIIQWAAGSDDGATLRASLTLYGVPEPYGALDQQAALGSGGLWQVGWKNYRKSDSDVFTWAHTYLHINILKTTATNVHNLFIQLPYGQKRN